MARSLPIVKPMDELKTIVRERGISMKMAAQAGLTPLTRLEAALQIGMDVCPSGAIEIPYADVSGRFTDYSRYKVLGNSRMRYTAARNSGSRLYWIPGVDHTQLVNDASADLYIVEGELKALAAYENPDIDIVALSGVYNYLSKRDGIGRGVPLPDFDVISWKSRQVSIVFDSDWKRKPDVKRALFHLSIEIESRGARVTIVELPDANG